MTSVEKLHADVQALDAANDYQGLQNYILKCGYPVVDIIGVVFKLMENVRLRGGYLVAKLLHLQGMRNPVVSFALIVGGFETGNMDDSEEGKRLLREQFDKQSAENQIQTYKMIEDLVMPLLSLALTLPDHTKQMLRLLDVMKQVVPTFRTIFDFTAETPLCDAASMSALGRARARLIDFRGPPDGAPRSRRRVIVAFRELFFPHIPGSRLFEQGPTMVHAMNAYGWDTSFIGMKFNRKEEEDLRLIADSCLREQPDILVIDAVIFHFPRCVELVRRLRESLPKLKIVGVYFDAWPLSAERLKNAAQFQEVMWSPSPDHEAWGHPEFNGKLYFAPLTRGGDYGGPILPLQSRMSFVGGVAGYNWHRALWISAMKSEGLPVDSHMSSFMTDGMTPEESYLTYMRRLADSRCSLNFSMRQNTAYAITARTFEILAVGTLLVQERCPEMDCYFIEGEHYLGFSNFAELRGIARFIQEQPREAERIRRQGNAFFREHYLDDKLLGYLEHMLYPQG